MSDSTTTSPRPLLGLYNKLMAAALVGAAITGCASFNATPEERVQQRAQERWTALMGGKLDKAYQYFTPAYKSVISLERYRGSLGRGGSWQNAEVIKTTCSADKCDVTVKVRVKLNTRGMPTVSTDLQETWLLEEGQWWLFQKP